MTAAPPHYVSSSPAIERLVTVADLSCFPDSLSTGDVKYELHAGRLVITAPPGADHGNKQSAISAYLYFEAQLRGLGKSFAEVAIVLARDPDTVLGADAAFVLTQSLPPRLSPEGYLETIPEIVVEIRSKNDSMPEVEKKVGKYLKVGVKEVWLIDEKADVVSIYRSGTKSKVLSRGEVLKSKLLPGFAVDIEKLLAEL